MLIVDESARERFLEVMKFAAENDLLSQLLQKLHYLDNYANGEGQTYDKSQAKNTRCTLSRDFAPLSFRFCMEKCDLWSDNDALREQRGKPWEHYFIGGLIYSGPDQPMDGTAPALTVSIESSQIGWTINT